MRGGPWETATNGSLTPLHHASYNGHESVVKMLLAANADVAMVDSEGSTPLHFAAFNGLGRRQSNSPLATTDV